MMQPEINPLSGLSESIFFNSLILTEVKEIYVIAHTGRKLIERLIQKLEIDINTGSINPALSVKILLKSPYSETQERYIQISDTISKLNAIRLKGATIEFRFYESLPFYRCVMCTFMNGEKKYMISSYFWLPQFKTKAFSYYFENGSEDKGIYFELAKSWFDHYWGKNEIHTIIFDFDDTIVKTFNLQIEAWCQTILKLVENKVLDLSSCSSEINSLIHNRNQLFLYIKEIFIEHQMAPMIFQRLFPHIENGPLKVIIEETRFAERERLTSEYAVLIENVTETLKFLREKYQLVIISATSETLIKEILHKYDIADCFSMILGKNSPKPEWENIYDKANLMIKLTKLIGIGIDRMIFIGDNYSDYLSARQIHANFIECRVVAKEEGINSMVRYQKTQKQLFFDSYTGGHLETHIEEINKQCSVNPKAGKSIM